MILYPFEKVVSHPFTLVFIQVNRPGTFLWTGEPGLFIIINIRYVPKATNTNRYTRKSKPNGDG
jgi:hypothetical protein